MDENQKAGKMTYIDEGWIAFCKAEGYALTDVAMHVAYSCGFQDGSWHERKTDES